MVDTPVFEMRFVQPVLLMMPYMCSKIVLNDAAYVCRGKEFSLHTIF